MTSLGSSKLPLGKTDEAERLFQEAIAVLEKVGGPENPELAVVLFNLATLYESQGMNAEADSYYKRSTALWEKRSDRLVGAAAALERYAGLLNKLNRSVEAAAFLERARAIRENQKPGSAPASAPHRGL
jgi:tetratricopeptide (TPR) repeat protein